MRKLNPTGKWRSRSLALLAVAIFLALPGSAQNEFATIRGVVTDPSGSAIPKAHIALINVSTNLGREVDANDQGAFEIPLITEGTYRLTASGTGFKSFVAENIIIRAREIRRIDPKLEIGSLGSEVTVQAGVPQSPPRAARSRQASPAGSSRTAR